MKNKWITLNPVERKRTYIFNDYDITFSNVKSIYVSDSGTHYIECDDGKCIVRPTWLAVILDVDKWTHPKHETPSVLNKHHLFNTE